MAEPEKKIRGVYEHPLDSGIWWIQYFEKGRRRRERAGRKGDAIKLYQKRKTQILQSEKLPELQRRHATFGELIGDVIAFARDHGRVMRNYEGPGELLREGFGKRGAEDIEGREFSDWINARMVKTGKKATGAKRRASNATFNRYRAFISLAYREGIRNGKVRSNVGRTIAQKRESKGRFRFLDRKDEYKKLIEALRAAKVPELRVQAFVFSVFSGSRLAEQFSLDWRRDVDLKNRFEVTFRDTKNGEDRTVPLNQHMADVLVWLRGDRENPKGAVFGDLREFCCLPGATLSEDVGEEGYSPKWFKAVCESVEIDNYTWHNNRHTFCSWLVQDGVSLQVVCELAGHRDIKTTMRYAHLAPDNRRAGMLRLDAEPARKVEQFPSATRTANG